MTATEYNKKLKKWTKAHQKGLSPFITMGDQDKAIDQFNKGTSFSDSSSGDSGEALSEAIELHKELNPKLWDNTNSLREDVYNKILEIVDTYIENSDILTKDDVIDIHLVGSNASFNYSKDSDVDIHIIINFENLSNDTDLMAIANNLEKSAFNKDFNIKIKGMDAELYVEDVNQGVTSNGIYSVYKKDWLKFPQPIQMPDFNNDNEFKKLYNKYEQQAIRILQSKNKNNVIKFINDIYDLRKTSIIKDGEYSKGNYVFKELRNNGYLDKLKQHRKDLISKQLTLEELIKEKYNNGSI